MRRKVREFEHTRFAQNVMQANGWNSTAIMMGSHYIAFGTPFDVVDRGMEGGNTPKVYSSDSVVTISEASVTPTNILRFEVYQPTGSSLTLAQISLETYNIPNDVVNCVRTTTSA